MADSGPGDAPQPDRSNKPPSPKRSRLIQPTPGVLRFAPTITMPYVTVLTRPITCGLAEMDAFSDMAYEALVAALYAGQVPPAGLITQAQFTGVICATFKARIDHVAAKVSGVRPANRLPLNTTLHIPRIIADLINGYGLLNVNQHSLHIYPLAAVPAQGVAAPAFVAADVNKFSDFVGMLELRGLCSTAQITPEPTGSASWTLAALDVDPGRDVPAAQAAAGLLSQNVFIRGQFSDFSPADAILAAVCPNSRNGYIGSGSREYPWTTPSVSNAVALRRDLITRY